MFPELRNCVCDHWYLETDQRLSFTPELKISAQTVSLNGNSKSNAALFFCLIESEVVPTDAVGNLAH